MISVDYRNKTVKEYCENPRIVQMDFGVQLAKKLSQRIDELKSFDSIFNLLTSGIDNPHLLVGDLEGCIGWDLTGQIRLILKVCDTFGNNFMSDCKSLNSITVEGVRDYHNGNKKWLIH